MRRIDRLMGFIGVAAAGALLAAQGSAARTVYVTVGQASGLPVANLTAGDFEVREGGRPVDVIRASPAAGRLQIAVIIDDNGSGVFRQAVATFVEQTIDRADVSIVRIIGQPLTLAPFESSPESLARAVASLGATPATPEGGQLLSAIDESLRTFVRQEAPRPIVLAMTVGGEEHSAVDSRVVLDRLEASGAGMYVLVVGNTAERPRAAISRPADLLGPNLHLAEVLGEGPRQSGGERIEIQTAGTAQSGIREILGWLRAQYAITYLRPPDARPSSRLDVRVTRPDVTLRAPSRIPAR